MHCKPFTQTINNNIFKDISTNKQLNCEMVTAVQIRGVGI